MKEERLYELIVETANLITLIGNAKVMYKNIDDVVDNVVLQEGECCYGRIWDGKPYFGADGHVLMCQIREVILTAIRKREEELLLKIEANLEAIRGDK